MKFPAVHWMLLRPVCKDRCVKRCKWAVDHFTPAKEMLALFSIIYPQQFGDIFADNRTPGRQMTALQFIL